jgi:tetratricopeptide (TPR) repeat protein
MRPGTTRLGGAAAPTTVRERRAEPAERPSGGNPALYVVLGGMFVALLGTGGYLYYVTKIQPPPTTLASLPPATAAPSATTVATPPPPPPTTAPPPTFGEAKGKGATAMKAAQAAFGRSDYDRALISAQEALREDPGNPDAKRMAENALNGQRAGARLRAAETALRQGDLAAATAEAEAASRFAPWDGQATSMIVRIRDAQLQLEREKAAKAQSEQAQKQQQLTAQVNSYINQATTALGNKQYDVSIKLYDEALKLDPGNASATQARIASISAKTLSEAAGSGSTSRSSGRSFVGGRTQASSAETKAGAVPEGFEESAGVAVKKGSQAAELPGKLSFEVSPDTVKPGERYSVNVQLQNEGDAPIQIRGVQLATTINGRKAQGQVPPLTASVAPRQKALLYRVEGEIWKEDTSSWSMEAIVTTARGETYRNSVSWR